MSNNTRQNLNIDLDSLFPGATIEIGEQSIFIKPLNIEQIAGISKKFKGVLSILTEKGITFDNFNTSENVLNLIDVVLVNIPDVLEEASNIAIDDLKVLPFSLLVEIVDKIIEVNFSSKDALEKNLKSLIGKFTPKKEELKKEAPKTPLRKIGK